MAMIGHTISEETRSKMSKKGENHPMYGRHHTAESKRKMSLAHLTYLKRNPNHNRKGKRSSNK